jgi:parallel beta-helix repeat protein
MRNKSAVIFTIGLGLTLVAVWLLALLGFGVPDARAESLTVCPSAPSICGYEVIQDAVDAASDGDVIKVAAGTYDDVNNYGGLAQVVYINKNITIRGGYTPLFLEPPNPDANPTTLDAGGQGRVIYIEGDISPTIEGLRITGGDATVLGGDQGGGGILILDAEGTIRNNRVFANHAYDGGGIHLDHSNAKLSANIVMSNTAMSNGGGVHLENSEAMVYANTVISNTTGGGGGGICLAFSPAILDGNTITANTANDTAGGISLANSIATLSNNTINDNIAPFGGGLYLHYSDSNINGNTILFNRAGQGGGLWVDGSDATLTNNLIADNYSDGQGSGLFIWTSSPNLLHTTIARNIGGEGNGLYIANDTSSDSSVTLNNTILVSQTVGVFVEPGNTVTLEGTLWGSGAWDNFYDWRGTGTINHTNDYWGNPDFVDYLGGDYHIGENSDAIDAGIDAGVTTDIDGPFRPYQLPDIGADEYWPPGALKFIYLPLVVK